MRSPWKGESSPEAYSRHKESVLNIIEVEKDKHVGASGRKTINMIIRGGKNNFPCKPSTNKKKDETDRSGDFRAYSPEVSRVLRPSFSKSEAKLKILTEKQVT